MSIRIAPMMPPATPKVGPLATAALVPDDVLAAASEFVAVGPADVVVVGSTMARVRSRCETH